MGNRVTIILALMLAVAGGWLYFQGYNPRAVPVPAGSPGDESLNHQPLLVDVVPADVESVTMRANGVQRTTLHQGDAWTGPAPGLVADLVHDLGTLRLLDLIAAQPGELKQFGLDPPRAVIELQIKGLSAPKVLEIGTRNPSTTGVYVRLGSGQIGVAGALIEWEFQRLFRKLVLESAE